MRSEFRKIIADGDLILQQKQAGRWWFQSDEWNNYRNESEEVRCLKKHMDAAFHRYKEMQELFVVAQKNVQTDTKVLQAYKLDNTEVEYLVPCELSILEERDGIKYSNRGNNKGNGGGNGSNGGGSNQNQKGQNQQQQKKGGQGAPKTTTIMELLTQGRIVMPNTQQRVS